jgi:hypothetical protein
MIDIFFFLSKRRLYRLRTIVITSNGKKLTFLTFSRACPLIRSQLTNLIWTSLDHLGNVLGVGQSVSGGANFDCQSLKQLDMKSELEKINTDI